MTAGFWKTFVSEPVLRKWPNADFDGDVSNVAIQDATLSLCDPFAVTLSL